jgi:hypothetical protein
VCDRDLKAGCDEQLTQLGDLSQLYTNEYVKND